MRECIRLLIVATGVVVVGCGSLLAAVPAEEEAALVDLYQSTKGVEWVNNTGWLVDPDPCTWFGVGCDTAGNTIEGLDLGSNNLDGPLPPSLGDLSNLISLVFSHNSLSGPLAPELGSLLLLQQLGLDDNHLTGAIPAEIGGLLQLRYLEITRNRLTGALPGSLVNLAALLDDEGLDLRWNGVFTTDAVLRLFLDGKQMGGDWEGSQTVAPENLFAGGSTEMSATLTWDTISYTGDNGRYEVYGSTTSGGPYQRFMSTSQSYDKHVPLGEVGPLLPDTTYYFVVHTVTYPHPENPRNVVVSDFSQEVEFSIPARSAYYVDPNGDDENDCLTPDTACATVNGAFAKSWWSPGPFYLAPGTYSERIDIGDGDTRHVVGSGVSETIVAGHVAVMAGSWDSYAALENLTLRAGLGTGGDFSGGVPYLFVRNAEIRGNPYTGVSTVDWGAYMVFDSVTIAENERGGIFVWACCASFSNCTMSGNFDDVRNFGLRLSGTTLENCTVTGNGGTGLKVFGSDVRLINTIVAGNGTADCGGADVNSLGHNLDGDGSCGLDTLLGDLVAVDPLLGPLRDNGGETRTHVLLDGSPAIDAGAVGTPLTVDQRGAPRPLDGDSDGTPQGDIGAVEYGLPFVDGFETGDLSAWSAAWPPAP